MASYDVLIHGAVWDAQNGLRDDHWVGVRNHEIATVSQEHPGSAHKEIETETIIPGLCDMHVHLVWDGSGDPVATLRADSEQEMTLRAVRNAQDQLHGGVTTIRDVGSVDDIAVSVAHAIRKGWVEGPRTYASGQTIIIPGGHDPFWGIESNGPLDCRNAVRELRSAGVDLIKTSATGGVYGQSIGEDAGTAELSREELEAIVDEAERFGLPVAAHAIGQSGIENAVEAGVDTIEHGNQLNEDLVDRLYTKDQAYDPTLFVYGRITGGGDGIPEYAQQNASELYDQHTAAFQSALARGCRILAGSDAGSPGVPHSAIHLELEQMVNEGMDPSDALEAATLAGVTELGKPDLGIVEPGTPADLVCYDENPLLDISATADPTIVLKEGNIVAEHFQSD